MHGDPAVVVEYGDEFKPGAECLEVLAQGGDADVVGVLEFGDRTLGYVESAGEFCLTDRFAMT